MAEQSLPASMRAAQYTHAKPNMAVNLRINTRAHLPPTTPVGGLLVKVLGASVNPVDYAFGEIPFMRRMVIGTPPITPGIDFVGRISLSKTPDFEEGDLVFGRTAGPIKHGSLAEFTMLKNTNGVAKVPDNFDHARLLELSAVGVAALTAYQSLKAGDLLRRPGAAVFINGGSGGTGTFGVQMAKHGLGCEYVVASCSGVNAERLRALGADEVIDYRTTDVPQALADWCKKAGRKFDLIVDNAGSNSRIYWDSHNYLKERDGKYIQVAVDLSLGAVLSLTKIFLWPNMFGEKKRRFELVTVSDNRNDLDAIGSWMAEGKVKSIIGNDNIFPLSEATRAYEKLKKGGVFGKIIVTVSD